MPEAESRSQRGEAQEQAGTADGERKGQIQKALVSETRIRQLPHPNAVISIPEMFLCRLDGSARRTDVQASNVTGQRLHLRASLVSLDYQITLSLVKHCSVLILVQLRSFVFLAQLSGVERQRHAWTIPRRSRNLSRMRLLASTVSDPPITCVARC